MKNLKKGEYGETPFGIISQSDILNEKELLDISSLAPELKDNFLKVQMFRTRTEMEVSVLDNIKFPTPASKYWHSVREQNVMFQELVSLSYEYRKNKVEIKIKERKLRFETDDLERELIQIEIEKKTFALRNQERTAKARIIEIKEWSDIKEREAQHMTEGELSDVDNHQLVSYTRRWIQQSKAMGSNGSPSERQNLLGQLNSGINLCIKRGVIDDVMKELSKNDREVISKDYHLK